MIIEGKTKKVYDIPAEPGNCLVVSKDRITAFNSDRSNELEGKAEISTRTMEYVYKYLDFCGVKTHLVRGNTKISMICKKCAMIPIEWVTRRVATGSFLRRNPGVPEGYKFSPPKVEYFLKDDANNDPQWSYEQVISAHLKCGDRVLKPEDVDVLTRTTRVIFEVLELAWGSLDCQLVDMKIEFGVDITTGELILADVIDSDSWRLWPGGDKRMMKDKQVYRDMALVTQEGLDTVKRNFLWVAERLSQLTSCKALGQVAIIAGSPSDADFCAKIIRALKEFGIASQQRYTSAHKSTEEALSVLAEYEGCSEPTVIIAVAGRSNGLGPVMSGNSCLPVINCPPIGDSVFAPLDIWSSMRLPSGLGCPTVISPEAAALAAAQILAQQSHVVWSRLRVRQLLTACNIRYADAQSH